MSYVYLSDLSPNLPMTTYEYARMKAFEAAGVDHETAKTRIYTERGSSGQPKVAAGPGDQPTPALVAIAAPPVSAPAAVTATPWWRSGLGLALLGGAGAVAGYFLWQRASASRNSMADVTGDEPTGVLSRNSGSERPTPYTLSLTDEDVRTIAFVGGRYGWSNALRGYEAGTHGLTESEMWDLAEAFESDTEGGHSPFPMLDERSGLYSRLRALWDSVV